MPYSSSNPFAAATGLFTNADTSANNPDAAYMAYWNSVANSAPAEYAGNVASGLGSAFGSIGGSLFGSGSVGEPEPPRDAPGSPAGSDWFTGIGSVLGGLGNLFGGGGKAANNGGGAALQNRPQQLNQGGWPGIPNQNFNNGNYGLAGALFQQGLGWQAQASSDYAKQVQAMSDAIGQQLNANADRMQQNDVYRANYELGQQQIQSQIAYNNAQIEQLKYRTDTEARLMEQQLAQQNQKLEFDKLALQTNDATARYQTDAGSAIKNKELDLAGQNNQAQIEAQMAKLANDLKIAQAQAKAQNYGQVSGQSQIDLEKLKLQQQQAQFDAQAKQKNDLLAMIMQNMGGGGGMGGAGGSSGGTGGGGSVGFTGPQGQFANMNINTGVTAGALNPATIRGGVSAIEGSGAGAPGGSTGGMTGAQRNALAQDMGAMNFAGGQTAGNDALRKFLPANAQLDLSATNAKNGLDLGYAQFLAEAERAAAGRQQNQNNLYLQLMSAI